MFSPCYLWELHETTKHAFGAKYKAPERWSRWYCTYSSRFVKASNCFFSNGGRRWSDKLRSASQPRNLGEASQKWHHLMTSSRCAHTQTHTHTHTHTKQMQQLIGVVWRERVRILAGLVVYLRHSLLWLPSDTVKRYRAKISLWLRFREFPLSLQTCRCSTSTYHTVSVRRSFRHSTLQILGYSLFVCLFVCFCRAHSVVLLK